MEDDRRARHRDYLRQYHRERDALLHSLKLCTKCKQQDAYTLAGRWLCADCAEKVSAQKRARYHADREASARRAAEQHRELYQRQRTENRCTKCGRPSDGTYLCPVCRVKINQRRRELKHERGAVPWELRGKDGMCFQCLTEPVAEGTRLCAGCLEKIRAMVRNRPKQDNSGHPWRKENRLIFRNRGIGGNTDGANGFTAPDGGDAGL